MLTAETEQRRQYDTAALRDALSVLAPRDSIYLTAESEQRRHYDTVSIRDASLEEDYPPRVFPHRIAETDQRRQYDTAALRDILLDDYPPRQFPRRIPEDSQRRQYDISAIRTAMVDDAPVGEARTSIQTASRSSRQSRRLASYYNAFQTSCSPSNDAPPNYQSAVRCRKESIIDGAEDLPEYSCSVFAQAKLHLCVESFSPLADAVASDWKEVYATVRGTMLSLYRLKDGAPGKLIYSYTLQHAEVGLAPDVEHTVLVPQTRFAHFIPSSARRRAWQKDTEMFKPVEHTTLRLRAETEQILLSGPEEEGIHAFMFAIGSAIDIAQPIDDRSIPRQCTVPRRRRRPRPTAADLNAPSLLAEQERIFQTMYPDLATERQASIPEPTHDQTNSPTREEDEADMTLFREEVAALTRLDTAPSVEAPTRPSVVRQTTSSTVNSVMSNDMIYATSPENFDLDGKWAPPHIRSPAQMQRYLRRCLPLLLVDAPRASDVLICGGKRVRVNWRMELLEEFELRPPAYRSHDFPKSRSLIRTQSLSSATGTASPQRSHSSMSNEQHDEITPVESGPRNLQLSKVTSNSDKRASQISTPGGAENGEAKGQDRREIAQELPTNAYCF